MLLACLQILHKHLRPIRRGLYLLDYGLLLGLPTIYVDRLGGLVGKNERLFVLT